LREEKKGNYLDADRPIPNRQKTKSLTEDISVSVLDDGRQKSKSKQKYWFYNYERECSFRPAYGGR